MLYWVDVGKQSLVKVYRAAGERKSKSSSITAGEDIEVVTNICCINNCMAIPEPILFIGKQLTDWMILWRSNYTRKYALKVDKQASQPTGIYEDHHSLDGMLVGC